MAEPNPALVPDPVEPTPKTYLVCGTQKVLGVEPGQTVTVALPPDQEARMLERGSLQVEADEYRRLSRSDLDDLARSAGVEAPEKLPNKDAVCAAIDAANAAKEV